MKLKTGEKQAVIIHDMARSHCCNYDSGFCLRLDDVCPQELSASGVICKHFMDAILPVDMKLCKRFFGRTKL